MQQSRSELGAKYQSPGHGHHQSEIASVKTNRFQESGTPESRCVICGSPVCVSSVLAGGTCNYHRWTYSRCSACGFLFLNPLCSEEELQTFYSHEYNPSGEVFNSFRDRPGFRQFEARLRLRKILNELGAASKRLRWLEVGCGYGNFLEVCKKEGIDIIGQDLF